ncbi:putative bifunctional diguanylate cyclase/phosphodiesterase [Halomonas sp. M20]|uniref:putative bifunctional diguanylate cyclase/phosphodiesterase n=1 Tax=Halomonas sp. M20 TaxID=2763264 RepID=UPI001D0A162E|nr:EAL domain-containing protein [Halomonas sp. M20]
MRLHAKVLLVVVPLAVIPLLMLGWLAYDQLRSSGIERSSNQMTTLMDQLARSFQMHQNVAEANIQLFADASLMRTYALTEDEEERYVLMLPSLLKLFTSYLRAYPDYTEIRFLLPDGYEDARATLEPMPNSMTNEGETPFFKALSRFDGETMSRVSIRSDVDVVAMQVARPIRLSNLATEDPLGAEPVLRGYLIVTMTLDFMREQMAASRIGETGHTLIVNKIGEILFHQDPSQIGEYLPSQLLETVWSADGRKQLLQVAYQDEPVMLATRRLHEDLALVGVLPESELLAESQRLEKLIVWIVLGTVVLMIVALLIAMNLLMVRPLKQLMHAVREIGSGNLTPKIPLSSSDELGLLALSFQEMGLHLQTSRHKIERLAYHDSLTGLPNRLMFHEYLQHMVSLARRENTQMAILFLDLDNFKRINDTLGHQIGDQLLKDMAARLTEILRLQDFIYREAYPDTSEVIARLGGDEFVILLPNIKGAGDAAKIATRILKAMKDPIYLNNHELCIGTSIGISLFPDDGAEVTDLVKYADAAMYHAKEQGRNNFQFYSASQNLMTTELLSLESRLRRALSNSEFELYYQPQVRTETGEMTGVEALLRWNDPEHGIISPDQFIPIAEDCGLILPIGEWVLHEACRQTGAWMAAGLPPITVSVNVSGIQLQRQELPLIVDRVLADTGLKPEFLELEITETTLMKVNAEVIEHLSAMQRKGITISLDDFGTGYSSLSLLRGLPIGKLKIDKSFVQGMLIDPQDEAIVLAILFIAASLGLETTAEGVETQEQAIQLAREGCNSLQGYLLSRPLPALEMTKLLKSGIASETFAVSMGRTSSVL